MNFQWSSGWFASVIHSPDKCRHSARVAVGIGRIVEPVVDDLIRKLAMAPVAFANTLFHDRIVVRRASFT